MDAQHWGPSPMGGWSQHEGPQKDCAYGDCEHAYYESRVFLRRWHQVSDWLNGWAATLRIMIFERETYKLLRSYELEDNGPAEVPESGE